MKLFVEKIQMGQIYLQLWPREKSLAALFPENRIIAAVEFAMRYLPVIALFSVLLQFKFGMPTLWPVVIASVFFMASLPLQGYYWLGQRAGTRLPPALSRWYVEINDKLGQECASSQPRYLELAETLEQAFKRLDRSFISL